MCMCARVQALKQPDCPVRLCLMTPSSCGLGTDLPAAGAAVLFDSDWHAALDVGALRRAHRLGEVRVCVPLCACVGAHVLHLCWGLVRAHAGCVCWCAICMHLCGVCQCRGACAS